MLCLGILKGETPVTPLGERVGLPCLKEGPVYGRDGGRDGGFSSSIISITSPSGPGTLSYCEALEARLEPETNVREWGRRCAPEASSGATELGEGGTPVFRLDWLSRIAAALTASSLPSEGLTQRGPISLRMLDLALEL